MRHRNDPLVVLDHVGDAEVSYLLVTLTKSSDRSYSYLPVERESAAARCGTSSARRSTMSKNRTSTLALAFATATAAASSGNAAPPSRPTTYTPAQLVDALHAAFGIHRSRAVHAKGIILEEPSNPIRTPRRSRRLRTFSRLRARSRFGSRTSPGFRISRTTIPARIPAVSRFDSRCPMAQRRTSWGIASTAFRQRRPMSSASS